MSSEAAPSVTVSNEQEDVAVEALEKLNAGKRNLACDEVQQAVESLAEACQLLVVKYGEQADELAEAYFYYGKALLELARVENGVLGNALDGVPQEEENENDLSESEQFEKASTVKDDERDDVRTQVYDAMSESKQESTENDDNSETNDKVENGGQQEAASPEKMDTKHCTDTDVEKNETDKTENEKTDDLEKKEDQSDNTSDQVADSVEEKDSADDVGESAEDEEPGTSSQGDDEDDADSIPNLQLAWEVLELSKKIYKRKDDKQYKIKLADVYLTLGEVSVESEQYDQAIQDFTSCLTIQNEILEADDRLLAETHYQLGTAHLLHMKYSSAVEELRAAKSILECRVANIEKKLAETTGDDVAAKEKLEKEVNELKQLLPDITAKVEDAEDEAKNAKNAENQIKEAIALQGRTTIGFGDNKETEPVATIATKKVNDISNLVRKRKPEELDTGEAKKSKSVTDVNGGAGDRVTGEENNHNGIPNNDQTETVE